MRTVSKLLAIVALVLSTACSTIAIHATAAAQSAGSITVAPAALQLGLQKGQNQTTASFTIHNTYPGTVQLHFALEMPIGTQSEATDLRPQLSLASPNLSIAAGDTATQTVIFKDAESVQPGSQQMTMVVSQQGSAGIGVGVLPAMRLPVTVIKYDGAVTSLGLANITAPRFAVNVPHAITIHLRNTGNMAVIPRGTVAIVAPNGTTISKGAINTVSKAVMPGNTIELTTSLTSLEHVSVPGNYRTIVSYSIGGDSAAHSGSATFIYVTWWHLLVMAGAVAVGWGLYRYGRHIHHRKKIAKKLPHKRPLLIGRDIT